MVGDALGRRKAGRFAGSIGEQALTRIYQIGAGDAAYAEGLEAAQEALAAGDLALLPAEGLYGVHALALRPASVARVLALKGGVEPRAFILLVGAPSHALPLLAELPGRAAALMRDVWPGPLTLVLPASACVPVELCRSGCVAVRCPGSRLLRDLALSLSEPLLSTSANMSRAAPPATLADVEGAILQACAIAIDGGSLAGQGSTIVRPERDGSLTILRPGLWRPPAK